MTNRDLQAYGHWLLALEVRVQSEGRQSIWSLWETKWLLSQSVAICHSTSASCLCIATSEVCSKPDHSE
jgi:hypothetical protein